MTGAPEGSVRKRVALTWSVLLGGAAVCFCAAVSGPKFGSMRVKSLRAEVPAFVDAVADAEDAHHRAHGAYLAIAPATPRAVPDETPVPWPTTSPFDALGVRPDGDVRGVYWVEVTADGADYAVHGIADIDGDGKFAHYTASARVNVQLVSPFDVY